MINFKRIQVLFVLLFLSSTSSLFAQVKEVTLSGKISEFGTNEKMPFVRVVLKNETDSSFVSGTISNEEGIFEFQNILPNTYVLVVSFAGYQTQTNSVFVGSNSDFLNLGTLFLKPTTQNLTEIVVSGKQDEVRSNMDKKSFSVADNLSQTGGSALQAMENLPGISIQDGKVLLRGSDKLIILIDGKQSALTGFGSQSGLDNLPASSIERIEIINNPSSKYEANGNAGIINIILKKETKEGFNGKVGMGTGLGALWVRKNNLPTVHQQYQFTPKLNPSISLNYRKKKVNMFLQLDDLYTQTLNKNEFVTRVYDDGTVINQQTVRNRNTNFFTSNLGLDWNLNASNQFSFSTSLGREKIMDHGDEVFFDSDLNNRLRLWRFIEDEVKTTVTANANYVHRFSTAGKTLRISLIYTLHREDERYTFDNVLPTYSGQEAFKLLSNEHVTDFNLDYVHPLKYGKLELGTKFRYRDIPTNMQFFPSANSPLDANAGGAAVYSEIIPAVYGNYLFETKKWEGEVGTRLEYVDLKYTVNPNHPTYKSDGYSYLQAFPNLRLGYKISENNRISLFFNRRVDRPNEVDIRIFPKYDDAEIIKVGNPSLKPQFTNSLDLSFKHQLRKGYWYSSVYSRLATATITRISTVIPNSTLIYAVFQNSGKSATSGIESIYSQDVSKAFSFNINANVYYKEIDAFTVQSLYPTPTLFSADKQSIFAGNLKVNNVFHLPKKLDLQVTAIYLSPDIVPQGKTNGRFTVNVGLKKGIQKGKGELYLNASDLFNTLVIKQRIQGNGFYYTSTNYYETQYIRLGYRFSF